MKKTLMALSLVASLVCISNAMADVYRPMAAAAIYKNNQPAAPAAASTSGQTLVLVTLKRSSTETNGVYPISAISTANYACYSKSGTLGWYVSSSSNPLSSSLVNTGYVQATTCNAGTSLYSISAATPLSLPATTTGYTYTYTYFFNT